MADQYDPKSCSALEKPYYKPIEAALRWCNLIQHEVTILQATADSLLPSIGAFPQWPCLRANAEKIYDAIINEELPHGRDGRTVAKGDHVAKERLTIRHSDLKAWMIKNYPDQKPKFLFDEIERSTHSAINADAFRALQADRDALKARIEKAETWAKDIKEKYNLLERERDSLKDIVEKSYKPSERAETTYLNIIGGLLDLMLGKSPSGQKLSVYENQAAIISALLGYHEGKAGIAARTLDDKFAAANRSLKSSR
jgi:hypothetical protein